MSPAAPYRRPRIQGEDRHKDPFASVENVQAEPSAGHRPGWSLPEGLPPHRLRTWTPRERRPARSSRARTHFRASFASLPTAMEVAAVLGCAPSTVLKYVSEGKLPRPAKIGRLNSLETRQTAGLSGNALGSNYKTLARNCKTMQSTEKMRTKRSRKMCCDVRGLTLGQTASERWLSG